MSTHSADHCNLFRQIMMRSGLPWRYYQPGIVSCDEATLFFVCIENVEEYFQICIEACGQVSVTPESPEPEKSPGSKLNLSMRRKSIDHPLTDTGAYLRRVVVAVLPDAYVFDPATVESAEEYVEFLFEAFNRNNAYRNLSATVNGRYSLLRALKQCNLKMYPAFNGISLRAAGDVLCVRCGQEYRQHPLDWRVAGYGDNAFLNILCDGTRVKL